MEVYPRSSWFLVLLGFALIAATLQETTDCPTPDQVSCTSGTKCNSDEDCQTREKCCANACYTKRCIPTKKGVQGEAETDGPSETDCRPYIEKALKELETGEAGHAPNEPSDRDESAEDIPTVEITDDSSHQDEEAGESGEASDETEGGEDDKSTQQETAQKSTQDDISEDDSGETPDEKEVEKSEEKSESDEETNAEPPKKESAEQTEQAEPNSREEQEVPDTASTESQEAKAQELQEPKIFKQASVEVQASQAYKSAEESQQQSVEEKGHSQEANDEDSVEAPPRNSKEDSVEEGAHSQEEDAAASKEDHQANDEVSQEEKARQQVEEQLATSAESAEEGCPSPEQISCTDGQLCTKHRHCEENEICCTNKCYRRRCTPGKVSQADLDAESASKESKETKSEEIKAPSAPETGCPSPSEVSCTEGDLCSKHRQCNDDQICCPNKCYRKRCTSGTATSAELAGESEEDSLEDAKDESVEAKSAEKRPETGCPSPSEVSCTEGDVCSKHRQCSDDQICCPNKCYRKRCTFGTATSAELAGESEEDSLEDAKDESVEAKLAEKIPETGCPSPSEVSCTEGDLCSKHRQCNDDQICCPNKCYRKRCTSGTATSAELAEESEENSLEDAKDESVEAKSAEKRPDTGCPAPTEVSCVEGDLCSKHRHCGKNEICCPNKCYRRRCTPGSPTKEDLSDEASDEDSKEEEVKGAALSSVARKDSGCPGRDEVPCGGEQCNKNKECTTGEICCANKCYRKVCVKGTPDSDEEEDESEEEIIKDNKSSEAVASGSAESQENESDCPSPAKVSCKDGERCGDDDDCGSNEICCPNKCYNKRCVPGTKPGGDESLEEDEPIKVLPPSLSKANVQLPQKVEVKTEAKPTVVPPSRTPPEPKKEVKKPEVRKPESKVPLVPAKAILVVDPIVEEDESMEKGGEAPVEELSFDTDVPTDLRARDHVDHLLKLDKDSSKIEKVQNKVYEETLKELKRLYENAIKPLEGLYKYRDLSNRHFGDAEIFSKPLILFMGPWSGGKSSIINYLVNNEYNETALRTGAEPSPAYFNILMHGNEPEIIDGTELAADFTFSGLQKFGQGLEERLRGVKLPAKLLEKVNIVEIPGILEVRKQVSRVFPFNDACQWFIDRADIIFLVYDPSKLDVGPETEAILDQLKGREHQTRIVLNKGDQVKPEELMRVQGALIWNISPLMSSPQPPVMYTTSLWSRPYEPWAPVRLLQAQERAFLRDLRSAVDRRVENKIASARRFAVRVRNHAKMVDCYLTTYYNHKSVFGNRKQVANEIIERPQDYHIYEGLSTLTNISRYDLPDPDVYRGFFKLNPLYEFQQLSATCTYFRGCPINRLDIAIAYDLPELVGTYKRNLEEALNIANNPPKESPSAPSPKKTKKSAPGS